MQFIGWDSNTHNDMLVKKGLNTNASPETRTPYGDGAWNSLKEGVGAAGLTWVNWLAQFLNTMITAFLPQLHAVMILLLLIMAPIISIIGLARPEAIMRLLLVAFIINLWIPIWIIVNWVDNVLLSLLYENQGWLDSVFDMGYVLASLLTLSLYTAIPLLASFYIYTATADHIANAVNSGMAPAGGTAGEGAGMRGGAISTGQSTYRGAITVGRGAKKLTQK
jgi:hypothetical protein